MAKDVGWRTVNGSRVYISASGIITKGNKDLIGLRPGELDHQTVKGKLVGGSKGRKRGMTPSGAHAEWARQRQKNSKQAVRDAKSAMKNYGPDRQGMYKDFNKAEKEWNKIAKDYNSGAIDQASYEEAYHTFGSRFHERRKSRNRRKKR